MRTVRTLGRRVWETRLPVRFAGFVAICMLSVSVWFLWASVKRIQEPHSPHYSENQCFHCHEPMGSAMKSEDCFKCHDLLSRQLLPNAIEDRKKLTPKECSHPIKLYDKNSGRTVTQLCLGCHKTVSGYVAMINIATEKYVEIDMASTHPIGLMPTEEVYPKTLPLSDSGAINCITCHDQHATDKRLRMLRYYYPGNGHPPDFRPLCNDCHPDGWTPLRRDRADIVREVQRHKQ
mgnify:CR=1 FL=1